MTDLLVTSSAFIAPIVIGWKVACFIHGRQDKCFLAGLAAGYGFIAVSSILFLQILAAGRFHSGYAMTTVFLCALLSLNINRPSSETATPKHSHSKRTQIIVWTVILCALILQLLVLMKSPHGGGLDVWAIWKFKARILFTAQEPWKVMFNPNVKFSHFDYPIFYPLSMVWGWSLSGAQSVYSAAMVAVLYWLGFCCFAAAIMRKLEVKYSWAAPLTLAATPIFTGYAGSLYADTVIAYFFTAGIYLAVLGLKNKRLHFLFGSGFFLASSPLIKNEGMPAWIIGCLIVLVFSVGWRSRIIFLAGSLIPLANVFLFKSICHIPNHMVSVTRLQEVIHRGDLIPYLRLIFSRLGQEMIVENSWVYGWIFIGLTLLLRFKRFTNNYNWVPLVFGAAMLGAYIGVYLMTFRDLEGHLQTSLSRLLLHVYPVLFLSCLAVLTKRSSADSPHDVKNSVTLT